MKTKWFGLTMCLLGSAVPLRAGEDLQLDRDFSFRLTQPELRPPPPAAPVPPPPIVVVPRAPALPPDTRPRTPLGDPMPPGARPFQYNGQTYYYIPL